MNQHPGCAGVLGSVDLMKNKTQAMELLGEMITFTYFHHQNLLMDRFWVRRNLRDVNGHIDSSHSSLMDKQTRSLAGCLYSPEGKHISNLSRWFF